MQVTVLSEHGYEEALRGMAYSYHDRNIPVNEWWGSQYAKSQRRAEKLANMGGGHNKFLESMTVYIDIEATRAFWSEFDTYRVGTTKQSESTMHTLSKRAPQYTDFEEGTPTYMIDAFIAMWYKHKDDVTTLKQCLPEGWLQRRLVVTNYKVLKNIVEQRRGHRYKWWDVFIKEVLDQLKYKEFVWDTTMLLAHH